MLLRPPGLPPGGPPALNKPMPLPHSPWRALVRPLSVTAAVLLAHAAALWALHSGWRPPASTTVELARVEVELRAQAPGVAATAPAPAASAPTGPAPRATPERAPHPEPPPPPAPMPTPMPTQMPPAPASPSPASDRLPQAAPVPPNPQGAAAAPATPQTPQHAAPSQATPGSAASAQGSSSAAAQGPIEAAAGRTAAAPAAPLIVPPSSSAAHLHNPAPPYPLLSRRLGEQGRVLLRVRIEADGSASAAQIYASSGFVRLDHAAQQAVLRWRFVPGSRNGEAQPMWFLVPIHFVLE